MATWSTIEPNRQFRMVKFLYIADTHIGAGPTGFKQQERYPEKIPEILAALCDTLLADDDVDFVLHGGDMIDCTTADNILAAGRAFDLPVPVCLCLGNHDLTTPDAVEQWLALAPQFFLNGSPNYTIAAGPCVIHVAPNHWCERTFYWKDKQAPYLSRDQMDRLHRELNAQTDLEHILLTHSPIHGIPVEQTGFPHPCHCPTTSFTEQITGLARAHGNLYCVLGAHSHVNTHVTDADVDFVTVSSLIETPFEVKLFEVTSDRIEMSTFSLRSSLAFDAEYDMNKAFAQGRPVDRSLSKQAGPSQQET